MSGGINESGVVTFTANGALSAKVRVKLTSASTTTPPQVEVAGAGEQHIGITEYAAADGTAVGVRLRTAPGIHEGIASEAISVGATLYGAASGKVKDTSDGTAIGIAVDEATANNDVIRFIDFTVISTTAATVSIADSGSLITGVTVEAALAEIMQGIKTVQYQLQPDWICLEAGTAVTAFSDGASTVPGYTQVSNKDVGIRWNNHATPGELCFHFTMPQDLDDTANLVVHLLGTIIKVGGSVVDSPVCSVEAYFSGVGDAISADTNCGGDSTEFTADGTLEEATLTLAASNVPASPQSLTLLINPKDGELGTDDFFLAAVWLEGKRKCLTS
jgi:hypothetical protein